MPKVETPEYDHTVLADNLRTFRRKLSMSQAEMAERVGVSKSLYSKLELGLAVVSCVTARKMAAALGTTMEYLLWKTGSEIAPIADVVSGVPSEAMLMRIFEIIRRDDVKALAKQSADTLKVSEEQALAMIVRTLVLE